MRCYWINIDNESNRHRRLHMETMLGDLGLHGVCVRATTPSMLSDYGIKRGPSSASMSDSEFACTVSHIRAVCQAWNEDQEYCAIMEDDIVIPESLLRGGSRSREQSSNAPAFPGVLGTMLSFAPKGWKVLQICTNNIRQSVILFNNGYRTGKIWEPWQSLNWGAYFYVLNRAGMRAILERYAILKGDSDEIQEIVGLDFSNIPFKPVADIVVYHNNSAYTLTYPCISALDKDSNIHADHIETFHTKYTRYVHAILGSYRLVAHPPPDNVRWHCVHIPSSVSRGEHMRALFESNGMLGGLFVDAVTPQTMTQDVKKGTDDRCSPLETCCTLSHFKAIREGCRQSLRDGHPYFVVCEDDIVFPMGNAPNIPEIVANAPDDWEIIQLYTNNPRKLLDMKKLKDDAVSANVKVPMCVPWDVMCWSTAAYVVRSDVGERMLIEYKFSDKSVDLSACSGAPYSVADNVLYRATKTYVLTTPVVDCLNEDSTIHSDHLPQHRAASQVIKQILADKKKSVQTLY